MADDAAPIIIKKIKKGGHGAHGGAWKVAYADFVTAMMAFFLLLWLLSVSTDEQKAAIAEYFTPTVGLKDSKGIGFEGGEKPIEEGSKKDDLTPMGIVFGAPTVGPDNKKSDVYKETVLEEEARMFETVVEDMQQQIQEDEELDDLRENILIEETPEGIKITLMDKNNRSMFKAGTAEMLPHAKVILGKVSKMIYRMPQRLAIAGHTDSSPTKDKDYTNWELSADRANASRRFLRESGVLPERFEKVTGKADQELIDPNNPTSPVNRRITIILLKHSTIHDKIPQRGRMMTPPRVGDKPKLDLTDEPPVEREEKPRLPIYPDRMKPLQRSPDGMLPLRRIAPPSEGDGSPREIELPTRDKMPVYPN